MRVAMLTGSVPPQICGVGDYTAHLMNSLLRIDVHVEIVTGKTWRLVDSFQYMQEITEIEPDLLHIQYPTVGYGVGLAPHVIGLLSQIPVVVTLHEFSKAHVLRRISIAAFTQASMLITTTQSELDACTACYPWVRYRSATIPVASNIPSLCECSIRDPLRVAFFGSIARGKGIEEFIDLAKLSNDKHYPFNFVLIGTPVPDATQYYKYLRNLTEELPIRWISNLSAEEVALELAHSTFAYLPYPDGVSKRRTSLLAALTNGVVVITTEGPFTTSDLSDVVKFAATPQSALDMLNALVGTSIIQKLSRRGCHYAGQYSWDMIAAKHVDVYKKVLGV